MAQVYEKLALLGLALVCIVPTNAFLMNQIDQIYQQSVAVEQLVEGTAPEEEQAGGVSRLHYEYPFQHCRRGYGCCDRSR